ncbi:extracellular solute-binding protein [Eubacteriaceae bacterium ES3]|nr:extracellular solute-binding protein [Eubacteriaceae bacterium ES3]
MKKAIALLLIGMICILTACSGKEAKSALDPDNPVTLNLWHYYSGDSKIALEQAIESFNQTVGMENGVFINAIAQGSVMELEEAVTASANGLVGAKEMPDLFSCYPDKAVELDNLGKLCDLNTYFSDGDKEKYVAEFLNNGIFDNDRLLIVPTVKSTEILYANATALNEFFLATGMDASKLSSWEGIFETAKAYYQYSDGKSLMGIDSLANYVIVGNRQLGVEIIDGENGQAVLNRQAMKKVFDVYYEATAMGYFNAIGKFRSDDIKAGDLLAFVGSTSGAAYFPTWIEKDNTQSPIDFLALSYPVFAEGEQFAISQGAGIAVTASTPEREEGAALFLKWFTDPEQNIDFAMNTGYLPVEKTAYEDDGVEARLSEMSSGEESDQNVAAVYEIAMEQVGQEKTYASAPFDGSYTVRTYLEDSLKEMSETGKETVQGLRSQGLDDEAVLKNLDVNTRFEEWYAMVKSELDESGITYIEE